MTAKEFWDDIKVLAYNLQADATKRRLEFDRTGKSDVLRGQPYEGRSVYIASLANRLTGSVAGHVSEVEFRNGAICIVSNTHAIATPEQVEKHLNEMDRRAATYSRLELEREHREQRIRATSQAALEPVLPSMGV